MKRHVDFVHVETVEVENHIFSAHQICKCLKCIELWAKMEEKTASNITHSLDVAQIWPEQTISDQHVFKRLVKLVSITKYIHLRVSSVQVFFDNLLVFSELHIFLSVFLTKFCPIDQDFV